MKPGLRVGSHYLTPLVQAAGGGLQSGRSASPLTCAVAETDQGAIRISYGV